MIERVFSEIAEQLARDFGAMEAMTICKLLYLLEPMLRPSAKVCVKAI